MKIRRLSREEVRSVDNIAITEFHMPGVCLMENAGRGAAEVIRSVTLGPVLILCGRGNNAGDGFVIARHLQNMDIEVTLALLDDPGRFTGDAQTNWQVAKAGGIQTERIVSQDLNSLNHSSQCIVDAILGTGAKGAPRGLYSEAIQWANEQTSLRFSIDIPTGLDCDTGEAAGVCFRADHTCTFVAEKKGFANASASQFIGQVHTIDIGVPKGLLNKFAL